jgi:hypothetical protein
MVIGTAETTSSPAACCSTTRASRPDRELPDRLHDPRRPRAPRRARAGRAVNLQTADGDVAPEDIHLADVVDDAVLAAKALLLPGVEGKAGRVLSGGNTERIKQAVQALIAVLKAAGVDLDRAERRRPPGGPRRPPRRPPAPVEAKGLDGLPDPHDLVASLRAAARGE